MSDSTYVLSKTSFLKFEQCQKAFFLYKNHPYLRDKITVDKQLTFKRGHDVGFYAQQLFPGGTDVSKGSKNHIQALELTARLIKEACPVIYEATFVHNGVLVMADILCLDNGSYNAYEVKSSLKISETYIKDAYLQYYVIKNILPNLDDLFLVTLNPDYVLETVAEPRKLFRKRSMKLKATENFLYFEHRVTEARQLLEQNAIPNIGIGKHCFKPYQCDFFGSCWKDTLTDRSIFNLPLVDKNTLFEWYNQGIRSIDELGAEKFEKQHLLIIKNAIATNQVAINKAKIVKFAKTVKQPMAAMDMEIWNPAIPQLPGTKPFEQIPFLVCFYDGQKYLHFFADHLTDQREEFAQQLIALHKDYASVVVYDKTLEYNVIDALVRSFPRHAEELQELKTKIIDVFDIFLNLNYYDPAFGGNFSLKGVAAKIVSGINYPKIGSGLEAMSFYDRYRSAETDFDKIELKNQLVEYCNTDCQATLGITNFLINNLLA